MPFTEFCCKTGGSNLNAGTRTGNSTEPGTAADLTYASGSWVAATGVFTPASGDPVADGVAVGDFVSVYADGSTVTGFVGRVTARTAAPSPSITVSLTAKSGTAPTDGTGNRTLKVGGAWQGPNGASGFPFGFAAAAMTNSAGDVIRVNLKDSADYDMTGTGAVHNLAGPFVFEGYTTSYGDGGLARIDAGTSGDFSPITFGASAQPGIVKGLWGYRNGGGASNKAAFLVHGRITVERCVASDVNSYCFQAVFPGPAEFIECRAFNQTTFATFAGFLSGSSLLHCTRCISQNNAGHGFSSGSGLKLVDCIAEGNGGSGARANFPDQIVTIKNFTAVGNTGNGIHLDASDLHATIENPLLIANGAYGVNVASGSFAWLRNCAFGSGTGLSNTSGNVNGKADERDSISVTADPFVDRVGDDFRLNFVTGGGAELRGAGRGGFVTTSGMVSYPDVGAAQHLEPTPAEVAEAVWEYADRSLT